jgi:Trp operon repressor
MLLSYPERGTVVERFYIVPELLKGMRFDAKEVLKRLTMVRADGFP